MVTPTYRIVWCGEKTLTVLGSHFTQPFLRITCSRASQTLHTNTEQSHLKFANR